jgi:hypothetical protein
MPSRPFWPCAALLVGGALCLLAGGLALYGRHAVLDERGFADRATSTLGQDEVRQEIADRIADRLVTAHPELAAGRPVLDAAAGDLVSTPEFAQEFRRGAADLHHDLFASSHAPALLVLPGAGGDLLRAVEYHSTSAARMVPSSDPDLLALGGGRLETALRESAPTARRLARLGPLALAAGVALLLLAVLRAPTRRRGLRRAALAVAGVGGFTLAATAIARALLLATFDTSHGDAVVGTIWSAFLGDLRLWAFACGGVALVLAAAAEPGRPGAWRRLLAHVTHASSATGRLARAAAMLLVAVLLLTAPEVPVNLALVALAGLFVFSAAAEVARLRPARSGSPAA